MFIKAVKKKNKGSDKEYIQHRLVESYRTEKGPRQRLILNLGSLDLPKKDWKLLANRIEEIVTGQSALSFYDEKIESLAFHFAQIILQKQTLKHVPQEQDDHPRQFEQVDLNSISNSQARTLGAEYIGYSMFTLLELDSCLEKLGFNEKQLSLAATSIIGKLVFPASELRTRDWAKNLSAIDEILEADFTHLSHNALYRISDSLLEHKDEIERHLAKKEKNLFSLEEKIILYDLTNTYFEGTARGNKKAKRGRSKEKRYDCPLVTLGLVIDEDGFPKRSKILEGNVSEPKTLLGFLEVLQNNKIKKDQSTSAPKRHITVALDAGIATEDNLELLKSQGYDYVVVARNKPVSLSEIQPDQLLTIKNDKHNKVEVQLIKKGDENVLYCKSFLKGQKEQSMKNLFQHRFEQDLDQAANAVHKKGGTKRYDKVLEKIGRLKEKYSGISRYYEIKVEQKDGIATSITWEFSRKEQAEERFSGSYYLRTTRMDLDEKQIWSLYVMLTNIEDAFRSLKFELGLRPIYHQKEERSDAHLFITILAYHLLNALQTRLKNQGIHMRWERMRELMSSHIRVTTLFTTKDKRRIHMRKSTDPEPFHRQIYKALNINCSPMKTKTIEF
jgi:hypothetical protein